MRPDCSVSIHQKCFRQVLRHSHSDMPPYAPSYTSSTYSQSGRYRVKKEPKVEERDDWSSGEYDTGYGSSAGSYYVSSFGPDQVRPKAASPKMRSTSSTPTRPSVKREEYQSSTPARPSVKREDYHTAYPPSYQPTPSKYPAYPSKPRSKSKDEAERAPYGPQIRDEKVQRDVMEQLIDDLEEHEKRADDAEKAQYEAIKAKEKLERKVERVEAKNLELRRRLAEANEKLKQKTKEEAAPRPGSPPKRPVPVLRGQSSPVKKEESDGALAYSSSSRPIAPAPTASSPSSRESTCLPDAYQVCILSACAR